MKRNKAISFSWPGSDRFFPSYSNWFRGLALLAIPVILIDMFCAFLAVSFLIDILTAVYLVLLVGTFIIETANHGLRHHSKHRMG